MEPNHFWEAVGAIAGRCTYDTDGKTILNWKSPNVSQPSQEDIDAKIVELKAKYDAQAYARDRAAEYPSIAELTVALYDTDDKAAIETKRAAVKAKYPKPS